MTRSLTAKVSGLFLVAMAGSLYAVPSKTQMENLVVQTEARLDSIAEYAGSTTLGKDDVPVSVSGDVTIRLKNSHYTQVPSLLRTERGRTQMDAFVNTFLGVFPNSYVNMWAILFLPFDFTGYYSNNEARQPHDEPYNHMERVPFRHHQDFYGASIWEELTVGIDVRGGSFGGMAKLGGVLWVNSSPFTVWDRDPMPRFASIYETFEEERTVGTYYKEKTFQPVKEGGRAFWTNRSFGGFMMEMYNMPFDMTGHFLMAQPKDADIGTRDGLRLLAGQPGDAEMAGTLDFRGDVIHGRLAKDKIAGGLSLGANYLYMGHDKGLIYEGEFLNTHGRLSPMQPYIINSHVASLDFKGNLTPQLMVHLDAAMAIDDTVKFRSDALRATRFVENDYVVNSNMEGLDNFAFYAKVQTKHWEPITSELIFVPKGWYSPFGFTDDSRNRTWRKDEFYVNSGNMRYHQNLMGINVKVEPEFNRGRFDVQYSQHRQVEPGLDVIAFEYRLLGRNLWESIQSWSKFNSALPLDSGAANDTRYRGRMGVPTMDLKHNNQNGGLRGGTWETWEVFVPFNSIDEAVSGSVPSSEKWATTLAVDMAYDIGHWIGYERNVQLGVHTALSGVSRSMAPIAVSEAQKDMIMWSWFVNSEPAIALSDKFVFLGMFGFELFRAQDAFMSSSPASPLGANDIRRIAGTGYVERLPINYIHTSVGFGFDWDFAARAGLHFRYRYSTHQDELFPANDWAGHYVHAESKVWF